jgi:hypothetical protein
VATEEAGRVIYLFGNQNIITFADGFKIEHEIRPNRE